MTVAIAEAVHIGPTWERNPEWDGREAKWSSKSFYVLPAYTLGYQIIKWVQDNLLNDEGDPFRLTDEQKRFVLWWYAVDEDGRFVYRDGVLQRLKGWGKDPLAAVIAAVEFVGPCRFAGWATKDMPELMVERGTPVAKQHPSAWIQIAAVSRDQTRNTMTLFPALFSEKCKREHKIDIGMTVIYAHSGARRIEAVTSSPRALEGGRPTFVIRNETHHWLASNDGHEMAAVMERNATKSKDGSARALSITNAYNPAEGSVAQKQREAYEDEAAGLTVSTGVFYDSLEAAESVALRPAKSIGPDGAEIEPTDEEVIRYLAGIVESIRGDSVWLDPHRIALSIVDANNPPSRSRRFWFNQVVSAEDAWLAYDAILAAVDRLAHELRQDSEDKLRAGWIVLNHEPIVMFFDGSKSDDATGLVGCRLSDGYVFTIGVWQKPPGRRGEKWLAPREQIDSRVQEAMTRFNVVGFWGDPSHALDDNDATRYWDALLDKWHRLYKDQLQWWATKSGAFSHSIMWDMASPERSKQFVAAAELFVQEMENKNDVEEYEPAFKIDGHPGLVSHLRHAQEYPTQWGTSLWKGHRESSKKIDLAVCAVGARMLRRVALNIGQEEEKPAGEVWGSWSFQQKLREYV